jgi:carboxylate-amine ligase
MAIHPPSLTVGVEEEYLLVDPVSRNLVAEPPPELWHDAENALGTRVMPEMLRAQIEVATRPHDNMQALAVELASLRRSVADVALRHDAAIIAASTHPFALWWEQRHTEKDRYEMLVQDLAVLGRRLVICGMHVHVAIEDPDLRIDLLNQLTYFLPHLLTLSTSSPFWGGHKTGLKSYRTNVFRSLPRTGLPEHFDSWSEYQRHVAVLVDAGLIEDPTRIWWDIRPSAKYPTLEMRASDICTRWQDAITVASLYRCIVHMLWRLRSGNLRWRGYAHMLVSENTWRAQRYGIEASLMDYGKGELVSFVDLTDELIELVRPDAETLGCVTEVEHAATIVREGTSAERQIRTYDRAVEAGSTPEEALEAVVDELLEDTVHDT